MAKKLLGIFSMLLLLAGCSPETQPAPLQAKTYDNVIGVQAEQVASMYVGYHIGPGHFWEFNTKDPSQIKAAIDFLKKQSYSKMAVKPATQGPVTVDVTYSRLEFSLTGAKPQYVAVTFFSDDKREAVNVKSTPYQITSTPEEEDKLFLALKQYKDQHESH